MLIALSFITHALVLHLGAGLLGVVAGLILGQLHARASRRAAERALSEGSSLRALLGFPLRVGLPALALFALALLSPWALVGGLLSFLIGQRLTLPRADAC